MKARDESGINKDFPEKSTDWIATAVKRCTDASQIFLRTDTKERITIGVLKCNQSSYHLVSCWIFVYCSKKQTLANIS